MCDLSPYLPFWPRFELGTSEIHTRVVVAEQVIAKGYYYYFFFFWICCVPMGPKHSLVLSKDPPPHPNLHRFHNHMLPLISVSFAVKYPSRTRRKILTSPLSLTVLQSLYPFLHLKGHLDLPFYWICTLCN
jgi:hypothetical protein